MDVTFYAVPKATHPGSGIIAARDGEFVRMAVFHSHSQAEAVMGELGVSGEEGAALYPDIRDAAYLPDTIDPVLWVPTPAAAYLEPILCEANTMVGHGIGNPAHVCLFALVGTGAKTCGIAAADLGNDLFEVTFFHSQDNLGDILHQYRDILECSDAGTEPLDTYVAQLPEKSENRMSTICGNVAAHICAAIEYDRRMRSLRESIDAPSPDAERRAKR